MAEINIKLDLVGSTLQKGYTDFRFTRATRRGRAQGLLNNLNALDAAINEAAAQAGPVHQSIATLPLASLSAVKFGPGKALLKLNYQYSRYRVPRPNTPAKDLVRTRAANVAFGRGALPASADESAGSRAAARPTTAIGSHRFTPRRRRESGCR